MSDSSGGTLPATPPSAHSTPQSGQQSGWNRVVQPGAELGSRYHIVSLLGEGGMGSVYKAVDRELDRLVAIKVIRPGLVADPSAVQRFKQELLLGSRISHKHILRIHDLGEVEGLKFISMAFVDGEDLHTILRREGRLPLERALGIARQVADALAAAHAEGVVHRDLKPHNVLIDRGGTAFISDFGLAKSLVSAPDMTRSGELLGTPRYMAPEQVSGGPIDHRVDLYAFGLILYEMATGTVPFRGNSAIQELLARVQHKPPDPATINPDLPKALSAVILRCLETDPADRYQSADEILNALDASFDAPSGSRRTVRRTESLHAPLPLPAPKWWSDRRLLAAAAAVVLLAGAWMTWRLTRPQDGVPASGAADAGPASTSQAPARLLAVLPFRVLGDQQLRYVGDGVVEALSSRLFQLEGVSVISSRDVELARNAPSLDEAARTLGANLVVEGTVQAAGDNLRLVVNLHDIPGKRQIWSRQFTGTRDALFSLQDGIYDGIVNALSLSPRADSLAHSSDRPTDNIEAYDFYLKGRDALRSGQDPDRLKQSIDFFEQAIKQDGSFALAYAGLADASLVMYEENRDSFWVERARAAATRARELDDRLPEVHYSLGSVYSDSGRYNEAVTVLRRALELAPHSDEAHRRLGIAYQALGRKQEAVGALQKAIGVNPYFWVNHNALGDAFLQFADYDKAIEEFRRVTELEPKNPVGYGNMGSAYFSQGQWEKAVTAFQQSLALQPHWLTYSSLGTAYFYLKRYPEAVKAFEEAVKLNPNDAITVGNLADGLRWAGDRDRSRSTYETALSLAYKELQVNPRDATTLAMVALYQAKRGDDARARDFIRRAREIDSRNSALLYYEAVVHTLGGRQDAALDSLEKALAGGYSAREATEDPELQPLAASRRFADLLRRYANRQ